jgi:hypothetical protein
MGTEERATEEGHDDAASREGQLKFVRKDGDNIAKHSLIVAV